LPSAKLPSEIVPEKLSPLFNVWDAPPTVFCGRGTQAIEVVLAEVSAGLEE
jgi:hypothetical protein